MIDMHIHIMPGVDDGAKNKYASLQMGEIAEDCGTDIMVVTPHANMPDIYMNTYDQVYKEKYLALKESFREHRLQIQLLQGMEIFVTDDIVQKLQRHELITLNHTKTPLIEFDFQESFDYMVDMSQELLLHGYRPLLAHPERYRTFVHDPLRLLQLKQMGVMIQVNKSSVLGHFGRSIKRTADYFLSHGWVDVAASDAHGANSRTPNLSDLYYYLDTEYGCAELLLEINPRRILSNNID